MKTSINLFRAELIPKRPLLDFERLLVAILIVWVVGVVLRVGLEVRGLAFGNQVQTAQTQQVQKQQTLGQVAQQVAALNINVDLERRVQELRAEVQRHRNVLAEFQSIGDIQSLDYAALLTDLAQVHEDGLWLTRIEERDGLLSLEGFVLQPSLLARWMRNFYQAESLNERQFGDIQLDQIDGEGLRFLIRGLDADRAAQMRSRNTESPSNETPVNRRERLLDRRLSFNDGVE